MSVCYVTMEQAAANARYDEKHKKRPWHDGTHKNWSSERSAGFPYQARDGVVIWAHEEDLTPEDDFLA